MNRRRRSQIALHEYPIGFGEIKIFPDNRWVKLAEIIPWELVDRKYSENFEGRTTGSPAIESRMAFGALIIKQELNLSDEDMVLMIRENSHCQYFLGMSEFTNHPPFDSSKMVAFRNGFQHRPWQKSMKRSSPRTVKTCHRQTMTMTVTAEIPEH